ncbi:MULTISPECIES: helix-turn-helix domain-containing protein [Staphylococcus]|jgi:transcriptional regulator with XRE-family HTH domain|uniref:helix-turn-helix domain-containing protein n=1 Tax=Staphylococcus TaxID=1279 RepID=UPI00069F3D45|nr:MULTISPECIES: helix-turn-helix transcriptional regulator [Staphylococcus]MCH4428204.1 helix-turn-helix transcriptional regulator [Staphylococcus haemolyticus]MCH4442301.1 helix-turn-helix transcriptional regulator [Staphylococcus haemolyticus]MCH4449327.1 helix-turn-helix transcriptional regulator [Staphylococcus haemolyticus]MDK7236288.1 helix-turn-helix transcriptional regulator [Staphylococcus haemolyticus]MEB3517005.1 helix-turn-helix transcriptional regulator [Staphylococcus haemolytic
MNEDLILALCGKLKDLRKERKLQQNEVAKNIGINYATLSKIEGKKIETVPLRTICKLLTYYDMTLYDFIVQNEDITNNEY